MNSEIVHPTTHILTFVKHSRIPGHSTMLMMPRRRRSFLNCLCLMCLETNCLFGTNVIVIQLQSCKFLWIFYHSTFHRALFASVISTKQKSSSETHCQNSLNSVNNSKMTSKAPQIFWRSEKLNLYNTIYVSEELGCKSNPDYPINLQETCLSYWSLCAYTLTE